jgi:deoxyadenosine/deoxycytidine kinase
MVTLAAPPVRKPDRSERLEIIGVFGSGKTTLARRLVNGNGVLLAEDHDSNPFWGDAYAIGALGYLGYDLAFLVQHAHLVASARSTTTAICDWSFATDKLWASLRLGGDYESYALVHSALQRKVGHPLGYLLLKQSPDTILDRLERRGRDGERPFREHVRVACDQLDELVSRLPTESLCLVDDDTSMEMLEAWLETRRSQRDV